jgi:hypothetical protein
VVCYRFGVVKVKCSLRKNTMLNAKCPGSGATSLHISNQRQEPALNVDLFLKNVPSVVKELIGREATENRRSLNQETIALLEEALLHRVEAHSARPRSALEQLRGYVDRKSAVIENIPLREAISTAQPDTH